MKDMALVKNHPNRRGMTLIEVVVAMVILSMLSVGLLNGVLQSRKITEENIYHSAAMNATVGYLEQLKSLPYSEIREAIDDPLGTPLNTVVDSTTSDPIYLSTWNFKNLTINVDEDGNTIENMDFWVWPHVEDLSAGHNQPAVAIRMAYAWRSPVTNYYRLGNLKIVRSSVVTY